MLFAQSAIVAAIVGSAARQETPLKLGRLKNFSHGRILYCGYKSPVTVRRIQWKFSSTMIGTKIDNRTGADTWLSRSMA